MSSPDPVFIDTSGWIAILSADDHFHAQAVEQLNEFGRAHRTLFTTDWVFAETGNGLARTAARSRIAAAVRTFVNSAHGRLVRIDEARFFQALDLYSQAGDKTWGLIDCASFLVMRSEGIAETLSTDRHFLQAGFQCLLPTRGR
jgi:uncharacterized protein